ncbi:MAG: SDR family NAD(P)-dependent oxidoreductase [Burkholderiaceae bacterium]|nr:SDR family NAD(P)-dependent oxidoreductase [Burkholderiaceae bacterium]
MSLFNKPFRALIIGSSGTIGSALVSALKSRPSCQEVIGLHRNSDPVIDYDHLESIQTAYETLEKLRPFDLIINTIGVLHTQQWTPEKRLADLQANQLQRQFLSNAVGPALTIKHFSKIMNPAGGVFATLSAKVGSITDNRLGGWYSYRASKAALNMLIKTASIELHRTQPHLVLVAIHPGTVKSNLSKPFRGDEIGRDPSEAASEILFILGSLEASDTGSFKSYRGEDIPW